MSPLFLKNRSIDTGKDKDRYMMKRKRRKGMALLLLTALCISAEGMSAMASPEFARSQEEWASLSDNRLEWEEIPALVNEYNATVLNNRKAYQKDSGQNAEEIRDALLEAADDMESLAIDAEAEEGGAMIGANYRSQAASLRQQAESNVSDSQVILWQYEQVEDTIAQTVRESFIAYYQAIAQKEADQAKIGYLEESLASAQNRKNVGMGTELEVLTAKEALQNGQAALTSADAKINAEKKKLQVLCGWEYTSDAEIGALPDFDMEEIGRIDLEADTEKALSNNWQLRIDERKLQNAPDATLRDQYTKTVDNDRQQIKASVRSAYDTLVQAKRTYDTGAEQLNLSRQNLEKSSRQLSLGVISRMEYRTAENETTGLEHTQRLNEIAVFSAWTAYQGAVNGLASTGSAQ